MKRLAVAVVVLAAFTAGVLVTFPTASLVDALLRTLPPDAARAVERVGSSHLGLQGLTLEDVTLRPRPDAPSLEVHALSLRPSLRGLLGGRHGRPWRVGVRACAGAATALFDRPTDDDTVSVRFTDLDLIPCLAPFQLRDAVEGRASGDAALVVTPEGHSWMGVLDVSDARWQPRGMPRHLALRAVQASMRWRLDDVLHVDDFTLTNEELAASGSGVVRFPPAPGSPQLDLRVRLEPTPAMPQAHRDLMSKLPGSPPDAAGARTYRITGSIDAPILGAP